MKSEGRSGGVTAVAIVVFLSSAFAALRGLLLVLQICMGLQVVWLPSELAPPVEARTILIVMAIVWLTVAAWGSATGFGLLKLKAWARFSVLVFSALVLLWSGFNILAIYTAERSLSASPVRPSTSRVAYVMLKNAAVPGLIAVWWLVYFNRKAVRCRFEKSATRAAIA